MNEETPLSARLSIGFSCIAHTFAHWALPIFSIAALALEKDLGMTHGETVTLILVSNVLYGMAAPLAGWLGDRWSTVGMMVFFFLGTGGAMFMAGFASSPVAIAFWLAASGLFGSIYHPVGMAWLVRNAVNRGFALGVNGTFGAFGPAVALVGAGFLIDQFGWRSAFLVPGALIAITGVLFTVLVLKGTIIETKIDRIIETAPARSDSLRVLWVLVFVMIGNGIIYQATSIGLPKVFSERVTSLAGEGALGISTIVAGVYLWAGLTQTIIGKISDRYPVKMIYVGAIAMQAPVLLLAASAQGGALVGVAAMMVMFNIGALPAENLMVARYAPSRSRGLFYGLKFVVALGVTGGAGVLLEGAIYDLTGGFFWLFILLAGFAIMSASFALLLPSYDPRAVRVS